MPKIRKPPEEEAIVVEDVTPPTEEVTLELPGDDVGETVIEVAPEPKSEPKPEPKVEPKAEEENPLQKAVEATQRAEQLVAQANRQRDEALRHAHERNQELVRERGGRESAEYNSVLTAIGAEQANLEKAEADYAAAASSGDWQTAAKAQGVIARATSRLDRLEENREVFETRREALKAAPPKQPQPAQPSLEERIAKVPNPDAQNWLRKHPEFVNDAAKNNQIGALHGYLVNVKRVEQFSPAYFDALDTEFGFKAAPKAEPQPEPQPQRRSIPLSAPVSRDVPTPSGQRQESRTITLTAEERQIARSSIPDRPDMPKMTNEQKELLYAKNKQKLSKMRANGEYRQTTEQNG